MNSNCQNEDSNYTIISIVIVCFFLLFPFLFYIYISFTNSYNGNCTNTSNQKENYTSSKKIALLFLIYDEINNEDVWLKFLEGVDKSKYNIYIHYKTDKKSSNFEKYKLRNSIPTKWGDISLVKAQNLLLKEALKDPLNEYFIFLSNSCIPLKKFDQIYNRLSSKGNFSYFNKGNDSQVFPRCDNLLKFTDVKNIKKASQWSILNRKHADLLTRDEDIYLKWYSDSDAIQVPDEHAYITYLFSKGLEGELILTDNLTAGATTFTLWGDMDYKYKDNTKNNNPRYYEDISDEEIEYLINSPCFFGRKFKKDFGNKSNLLKKIWY